MGEREGEKRDHAVVDPAIPVSACKSNLLRFNVLFSDGGHHSLTYRVENMLTPDSSVYCTKKV
jgi:hypothetical protein